MHRINWKIAGLVVLSLGVSAPRVHAQEAGIAVGTMAPAAAVMTLDGKNTNLSEMIGQKPVVLEFWATWCPLCKKLEPAMRAARDKYGDRVTFVSVGVKDNQTAEAQSRYAMERKMGGTFVFDRDGNAVSAYKTPHTSFLVVIDATGRVVYTGVGPEQNVDSAVSRALAK